MTIKSFKQYLGTIAVTVQDDDETRVVDVDINYDWIYDSTTRQEIEDWVDGDVEQFDDDDKREDLRRWIVGLYTNHLDNCTSYGVYIVDNGAMDDFGKRHMITGGCRACGDNEMTLEDATELVRKLAEEESLTESRTTDFADGLTAPSDDDGSAMAAFDAEIERRRQAFVADCVASMGFEWQQDLKWVRVAKFAGGEFVEVL